MISKEDFAFGLSHSQEEIDKKHAKERRLREMVANAKALPAELAALSTRELMFMRHDYTPNKEYPTGVFYDALRKELNTREHIPNKKEGKALRREKAKMGRHRGKRDR